MFDWPKQSRTLRERLAIGQLWKMIATQRHGEVPKMMDKRQRRRIRLERRKLRAGLLMLAVLLMIVALLALVLFLR